MPFYGKFPISTNMKKNNIFLAILVLMFLPSGFARADVGIHLQVVTSTTTLYNQDITVSPCALSQNSSTTMVTSAYCALQQAGLATNWSWFGDDGFLNSINGILNNDSGNGIYWGWFNNLDYGQTALNRYNLQAGDQILVNYDINPLKIVVATTTPYTNATTTLTVTQFGLDSSFNPVWSPASTSTVYVGSNSFPAGADGTYQLYIISTSTLSIHATKTGFIDSNSSTLSPVVETVITPPTPTPPATSAAWVPTPQKIDIARALQFLSSQQKSDGSFGGIYTDWAAIAFGADGSESSAKDKLKNFLLTDAHAGNNLTDYERRAMALMSLGISPYDGTLVDYIKKITDQFDGQQFGDKNLYNDDIFAILPLLKAGYTAGDPMILSAAKFIISQQSNNGSWNGVDMTSAAIQALSLVPQAEGVADSISRAKAYLHSQEQNNGGFDNSFSTSWAIQATNALGDLAQYWLKDQYPQDYLASLQASDGGLENQTADANTRVWATSYAIPAAENMPWISILKSFTKPVATSSTDAIASSTINMPSSTVVDLTATATPAVVLNTNPGSGVSVNLQTIPDLISVATSSTDAIASSTINIASSTVVDLTATTTLNISTSTPVSTPEKEIQKETIVQITDQNKPENKNPNTTQIIGAINNINSKPEKIETASKNTASVITATEASVHPNTSNSPSGITNSLPKFIAQKTAAVITSTIINPILDGFRFILNFLKK